MKEVFKNEMIYLNQFLIIMQFVFCIELRFKIVGLKWAQALINELELISRAGEG